MSQSSDIVDLLRMTSERRASDLILTVGLPPMLRLDGEWQPTEHDNLTSNDTRRLLYTMMDEKKQRDFEERRELDFSFSLTGHGRFRVNAFFQRGAIGGVLRTIPSEILSFDKMGLPQVIADVAKQPRGLVLVTGPTGSGKSTTLAAMLDMVNATERKHIMTIEDPIEFFHTHKRSIINQRELGEDTKSFERALRAVLRQAPDVILVGEMRDFETIGAAVTAAETGHLVMGTLHTNSAPEAVDRIIDVFPEAQQAQVRVQLANNLQAILTQQLIPKQGGGRALAYEFLVATPAVRNLIREGKTHQILSAIQMGGQHGMQTMDACLAEMHLKRVITYDTGITRAVDAKEFARLVSTGGVAGAPQPAGVGVARPSAQPTAQPSQSAPSTTFGRGGRGT
jgi:twitching motility protein PilT